MPGQPNSACAGPAQQPSCKPCNLSLILFNIEDLQRATEGQWSGKTQCTLISINLDSRYNHVKESRHIFFGAAMRGKLTIHFMSFPTIIPIANPT